jgi:hypothetical protein
MISRLPLQDRRFYFNLIGNLIAEIGPKGDGIGL